jgi:hypothetical protein
VKVLQEVPYEMMSGAHSQVLRSKEKAHSVLEIGAVVAALQQPL